MSEEKYNDLMRLGNQVARSTVAVVDAVTQRGGFKGEELSTIGTLRDQAIEMISTIEQLQHCLLYTSPSPRDRTRSRMPSSA